MENKKFFETANNSTVFSACHQLTRKLLMGTKYNYHCTFTGCLKLYNSDIETFCMTLALYGISNSDIVKTMDHLFDFVSFVAECDNDRKAYQNIERCINIALNYGLKKRDIYRTKQEKQFDYVSDNSCPLLVDKLRKEDREDLKQEIFIYLYSRIDDPAFLELPNLYKLLRAGDSVVTNYAKKQKKTRNVCSFDDMLQKGYDVPTIDDFDILHSNIDDLVNDIVSYIPKIHREIGKEIIYARYTKETFSGFEIKGKERNISEIAKDLKVSERTIKTVLKEIKSINRDRIEF